MTDPTRDKGMMSEINVTPLVDVMLVLLIIFMISASIETLQVQQQKERIEEQLQPEDAVDQNVPVNLPRTNAEPVNLAEERKLVLSIDENMVFYVGDTEILRCLDLAPALKALVGQKRRAWIRKDDDAFGKCLDVLAAKLGTNEKLKTDQEMYLRADESLPYAVAIKVMARVRASGVAKFGLVAEPEQDGRPIQNR